MDRAFHVVLLPQPEGGFVAQCPSLPGCYSQGETIDQATANIREAIELTLEDMNANGEAVPELASPIVTEVIVAA